MSLASAPLSAQTRRTYASKARQYLAWLAGAETDGDPLGTVAGRDWAVLDYRSHLQAVLKRRPATVNSALAAVDDFYIRRGLGRPGLLRRPARRRAPVPEHRAQVRYLRAVDGCPSARDQAVALVPFYAGTRISELARQSTMSGTPPARACCGSSARANGSERSRSTPSWPRRSRAGLRNSGTGPARRTRRCSSNQRGGSLSVKAAHAIITGIAYRAGLDDEITAHVLRHTFATTLVRGGTDLVIVAELLGHARLETTRGYTRSTEDDRTRALDLLPTDE